MLQDSGLGPQPELDGPLGFVNLLEESQVEDTYQQHLQGHVEAAGGSGTENVFLLECLWAACESDHAKKPHKK